LAYAHDICLPSGYQEKDIAISLDGCQTLTSVTEVSPVLAKAGMLPTLGKAADCSISRNIQTVPHNCLIIAWFSTAILKAEALGYSASHLKVTFTFAHGCM
jgi:hypothetical protein